MYIQLASDLHLNCNNNYSINKYLVINNNSNILILNGDICSVYEYDKLVDFFNKIKDSYKHIIYVPGNHEYYKYSKTKPLFFSKLYRKLDCLSEII